jgi:hypothetical protein
LVKPHFGTSNHDPSDLLFQTRCPRVKKLVQSFSGTLTHVSCGKMLGVEDVLDILSIPLLGVIPDGAALSPAPHQSNCDADIAEFREKLEPVHSEIGGLRSVRPVSYWGKP